MIFRFPLTFSIIILYIYIIMLGLAPFAMISLTSMIFVILGLFMYIKGWSSKTFKFMENGIGNIIVGLILFTYLIWISWINKGNYINLKSGMALGMIFLNVAAYTILCFSEIFRSRSGSLRIFCDHSMLKNDKRVKNPFSNVNAEERGGLFAFLILLIHVLSVGSILGTFAFLMAKQMNFPNQEIKIPSVIIGGNVMAALAAFSGVYLTIQQTKSSRSSRSEEKSLYCKTELLDEQGLSDYLNSDNDESETG